MSAAHAPTAEEEKEWDETKAEVSDILVRAYAFNAEEVEEMFRGCAPGDDTRVWRILREQLQGKGRALMEFFFWYYIGQRDPAAPA